MKSHLLSRAQAGLAVLAASLALVLPQTAVADARDRLFETGTLAELPVGAILVFTRTREVPPGGGIEAVPEGELTIRIAGTDAGTTEAHVRFDRAARDVSLPPSPTTAAHPALLVFLETTVQSLSEITGGSPHYLKNRFIGAFAEPASVERIELELGGRRVPAERMLFRPFEGDPHADELGSMAGLELVFILSDAVPGELYSASARGGDYAHELALESAEENP